MSPEMPRIEQENVEVSAEAERLAQELQDNVLKPIPEQPTNEAATENTETAANGTVIEDADMFTAATAGATEAKPAAEAGSAESTSENPDTRRKGILARIGSLAPKVQAFGAKVSEKIGAAGEKLENGPTASEYAKFAGKVVMSGTAYSYDKLKTRAKEAIRNGWENNEDKVKKVGSIALAAAGPETVIGNGVTTATEKAGKYASEKVADVRKALNERATAATQRKEMRKADRAASKAERKEEKLRSRANKLEDKIDAIPGKKYNVRLQDIAGESYDKAARAKTPEEAEKIMAKYQAKYDALRAKRDAEVERLEFKHLPKINALNEKADEHFKTSEDHRMVYHDRARSLAQREGTRARKNAEKLQEVIDKRESKFDAKIKAAEDSSYGKIAWYRNRNKVIEKREANLKALEAQRDTVLDTLQSDLGPQIKANIATANEHYDTAAEHRSEYRRIKLAKRRLQN